MNLAHWHLSLNHFPIIAAIIGFLLLLAALLFKKHSYMRQIALLIFVFAALTAIPAFLTGEGAEELIENMKVSNEASIESHEDQAKVFMISVQVLGAFSLLLLISKLKNKSILFFVVLLLALNSIILGGRAAFSGGEIRHTEISQDRILIEPAAEPSNSTDDD